MLRSIVNRRARATARRRPGSVLKGMLSAAVAAAFLISGTVAVLPSGSAEAAVQGCSFGTGGPSADQICWIDFSSFNTSVASTSAGQPMSIDLGNGIVLTFTAKLTAGPNGSPSVAPASFPTYANAALGRAGQYENVSGRPALYQQRSTVGVGETVTLDNIALTHGFTTVTSGWSLLMADAESSNSDEGFEWVAAPNVITQFASIQPTGYAQPCSSQAPSWGQTSVTCLSGPNTPGSVGSIIAATEAPTRVASTFRDDNSGSMQGVAFAVLFDTVSGSIAVNNPAGSSANGSFTLAASDSNTNVATTASTSASAAFGPTPVIGSAVGHVFTFSLGRTSGTPLTAYDIAWTCTDGGQPVSGSAITPNPTAGATTVSVISALGQAANCEATLTARPPVAGNASGNVATGGVVTLRPAVTAGRGAVTGATFDNGQTMKVVPGEGTWAVSVVSGQPVTSFTPASGFSGSVTPQVYTVTDTNGLTASGTLSVSVFGPPTAGDDSAPFVPGQALAFAPVVTPGAGVVSTVAFDNGLTTKVVPGEGTWSIALVSGQPAAILTPVSGFRGTPAAQRYTVTDANGLAGSGVLTPTARLLSVASLTAGPPTSASTSTSTPTVLGAADPTLAALSMVGGPTVAGLAVTGGSVSWALGVTGIGALVAGIAAMLLARRRTRTR